MHRLIALATLLLAPLLTASLVTPVHAQAPDRYGMTELHNVKKGSLQSKTAWIHVTRYGAARGSAPFGCSASLIGPKVLVTAAHCLRKDNDRRGPKAIKVFIGRHYSAKGKPQHLIECQGKDWWASLMPTTGRWEGNDFAVFSVAACRTPGKNGVEVRNPGHEVGWLLPRSNVDSSARAEAGAFFQYLGYPDTYKTDGHLQTVVGYSRACGDPVFDTQFRDTSRYQCHPWAIQPGGSGGPLTGKSDDLLRTDLIYGVLSQYQPATGPLDHYNVFTLFPLGFLQAMNMANKGQWDLNGLGWDGEKTYGTGGRLQVLKPAKHGGGRGNSNLDCDYNPASKKLNCTYTYNP